MTSELDIYNLALTRIGHEPVSSLTEASKGADRCRLHYPAMRDAVLRAHPWNFAIRRAALAQLSFTPAFEFTYAFALPTDPYCLKVLRTSYEAEGYSSTSVYGYPGLVGYGAMPIEYRIETVSIDGTDVRALLCNESSMSIEYIARITDTSQYDALFVDALAARLAAEIAIAMTDNHAASRTMMEFYQMKLSEARVVDAQEGTPRDVVNTDAWLIARL